MKNKVEFPILLAKPPTSILMEIPFAKSGYLPAKLRLFNEVIFSKLHQLQRIEILQQVRQIGFVDRMDDYERRKLGIFNQLNFFQLLIGVFIPLSGLFHDDHIPAKSWIIAILPSLISIAVLAFNYYRRYESALLSYFILYPFFTSIVYVNGMNTGVELNFILYGVLSVFFLQDIGYMLFTVAFSMVNYFVLSVLLKDFLYQVETQNRFLYLLNQVISLGFIFYGLYLIKKENTGYQFRILFKNRALHKKNIEIKKQKGELAELNSLKTKLFSVIAHDLKSPMYALRGLFSNMQRYNVPAEDIKASIPEVVKDINYTIGLMENLLQWSKTQMQKDSVKAQEMDITQSITEVTNFLELQAKAKKVFIETKLDPPVYVFADKEMINLVLRNLLSNAIKFTPENGTISIGINESLSFVEVYVQDSGVGMSKEVLQKIQENIFYTTKGTAAESGTGLGLMLCKEFLAKNGGIMHIESEPGQGSTFSFTLPVEKQN